MTNKNTIKRKFKKTKKQNGGSGRNGSVRSGKRLGPSKRKLSLGSSYNPGSVSSPSSLVRIVKPSSSASASLQLPKDTGYFLLGENPPNTTLRRNPQAQSAQAPSATLNSHQVLTNYRRGPFNLISSKMLTKTMLGDPLVQIAPAQSAVPSGRKLVTVINNNKYVSSLHNKISEESGGKYERGSNAIPRNANSTKVEALIAQHLRNQKKDLAKYKRIIKTDANILQELYNDVSSRGSTNIFKEHPELIKKLIDEKAHTNTNIVHEHEIENLASLRTAIYNKLQH